MINDEKCREVAERLSILASHAPADKDYVLDALGLYPGEYIDGFDPYCVNELADLIDRPTCTIVNSWQEITPGLGELDLSDMCGFELSCGHEVNGYEKPHYCSECGAVVVDED